MEPVRSSNIAEIGHDPSTNTLRVKFVGGRTAEYPGVTSEQHAALMGAHSIGSHLWHNHIKGNDNFKYVG